MLVLGPAGGLIRISGLWVGHDHLAFLSPREATMARLPASASNRSAFISRVVESPWWSSTTTSNLPLCTAWS